MKADRSRLIWIILAVLYFAAIAVLCFARFPEDDSIPMNLWGIPMDKLAHCIMFLPFAVVTTYAFHRSNGKPGRFCLFMAVMYICGLLLASGTEVGQSFTSYRSGDPFDFLADTVGLALGTVVAIIIRTATKKW